MEKPSYPLTLRRLRANEHIRDLVAGVSLHHNRFIQPIFVGENLSERKKSAFLPGVYTETTESLLRQTEHDLKNGVNKFLFFPVNHNKFATDFTFDFAAKTTQLLKKQFGNDIWLANDLCLCGYTIHGHCGILDENGERLLNQETVEILSAYALQMAQAGTDCIAPSDMMDGRIKSIRNTLDNNHLEQVSLMAYSAKFASSFYGPFRDLCNSGPTANGLNDRSTYQIDYRNPKDAIKSALRDIENGADIIMVKPGLPYLDIVKTLSEQHVPLAIYQVSGEYAALEALVEKGLAKRDAIHIETWYAAARSGANMIISYAARHAKEWLGEK